ncbi:peptidylprolyl isomerase [uncultured Roseobacter sp.]|uniref:peptidylprolyl isomerase n=1 Tax=uncultured Roseobacter sp. TaxID=114847 RepID=UPI0026277218|nr:peptidylprolyl isomerase [uncultured Roseobacter sp.]
MFYHRRFITSAALVALLALPAQAQDTTTTTETAPDPDAFTVLATVGNEDITLGHVIAALALLPPEYHQLSDEQLYDGLLAQLIQQSVLAQSFEEELPTRLVMQLENEKRALVAREVVDDAVSSRLTEERIAARYDETFGNIQPEPEYNASHILVETEEEALKVIEAINNGADFAETAREFSTGPSGPNGGSLGWFGAGMMVPQFEAATIALAVEEVSGPVETQFGWHVIRLNDTRSKNIPTLEDARPDIEAKLSEEIAYDYVDRITDEASVTTGPGDTIDRSWIRRQDLLEN